MRKFEDIWIEQLKDTEQVEIYLNNTLEEFVETKNADAFLVALEHLAKAKYSMTELAKKLGISRKHLYRIFANESNPSMLIISQLIDSLGYKIEVKSKTA